MKVLNLKREDRVEAVLLQVDLSACSS